MRVSRGWCTRSERRRLAADPARFLRRYDLLDRPRLAAADFDRAEDESIRSVVQSLKHAGIARWEGFLSAEEIEELCGAAQEVLDRARTISASLPPGGRQSEAESGGEIWRGSDPGDGRVRMNFPQLARERMPAVLRRHADDSRMSRVVQAYYGVERVWSGALLVEELSASRTSDVWHFDKIFDQIKVMVLLGDVTEEQGPLRYKVGTHRRPNEADLFFHESFRHGPQEGLNYNYPPKPLVERLPGALELGTGRAGDAIFFDTLGLHAGSICWSGARTALVTSFNAATAKNDWIYRLFFPERAP